MLDALAFLKTPNCPEPKKIAILISRADIRLIENSLIWPRLRLYLNEAKLITPEARLDHRSCRKNIISSAFTVASTAI
jgi:hypothetical protein